ncbi:MAG: hypothetical protein KTR16_09295 [Acidiferrobacterales bacterium]|nr:hypothetical protein [Acidiferrobacterales bacterium]
MNLSKTLLAIGLTTVLTLSSGLIVASEPLSATRKLEQSLSQIQAKDQRYNAVTALNPQAKADAMRIDEILTDNPDSLLAGLGILVKDNIDVKGMATTAGSLALKDNYPKDDAPLIAQLKQHGGVIVGKANLSEWANFRSEKSSSGWSAIGGQTTNPSDISRTPCGSSAGSGAAVAAGYVQVAIGTETNGSIVCPASINGIVGFKPTHGIVSGEGIVPLALTQDTAGPMASSIEYAAEALAAMVDPKAENAKAIIDGLKAFDTGAPLKGMKIGVMASTQGFDVRRDQLLDRAINRLKVAGAEVITGLKVELPENFGADSYRLLQYEFKRDLNDYFANREYQNLENPLRKMTLAKLIAFNNDNADTELKHFDQDIFEKSQALELTEDEYKALLSGLKKATREEGLDKLFKEHNLNAIIGTTVGPAWKIDHINGDAFFGPSMSTLPAIGGHPHITTPNGRIANLPVGLSFIGQRHEDHKLAQIVYRFSQL